MGDTLRQIGENCRNQKVRIGILENATTEDGKQVAEYAAYNEYGTRHIPPRPFMRLTIGQHKEDWVRTFVGMIQNQNLQDPSVIERAFTMVGVQAVGHIQETIDSNVPPPNADSTRRRKQKVITGANGKVMKDSGGEAMTHIPVTLVMNGTMRKAIAFEVNRE